MAIKRRDFLKTSLAGAGAAALAGCAGTKTLLVPEKQASPT